MNALEKLYKDALLLRLRLEAERCGMTELAKKCGIESSNLYKVLSDDANPTIESLIKIAIALELWIELRPLEGTEVLREKK